MSNKCALRKMKPSHACRVEQQKVASELEKLQNILESKEAQMARVMNGDGQIASLRGRYDHMFKELQAERDDLKKERLELLQVCLHPAVLVGGCGWHSSCRE